MKSLRLMSVLVLAAFVRAAGAQVTPPPANAIVVNFDDVTAPIVIVTLPGPVTTEYANRGVTFGGFGQNGGALTQSLGEGQPSISPPNKMIFLSAFSMLNGGLLQSPENMFFYPAVTHVQFDVGTFGADCTSTITGPQKVFTEAFAPGGASLGMTTTDLLPTGNTVIVDAPPPGIDHVVVTSTHSCGDPGFTFFGVELFSIDNVAFVEVPSAASRCANLQMKAAQDSAKAKSLCFAQASKSGQPVSDGCLGEANTAFDKAFAKASKPGDCVADADSGSIAGEVDNFINTVVAAATGGDAGPDACGSEKLKAVAKKVGGVGSCYAKAASKGAVVDSKCVTQAVKAFNNALKKCGTTDQLKAVESAVDSFVQQASRAALVPTTTTTTTSTSTTTTTTAPPLGTHLSFTTTAGTANCGTAGFGTPPDAPFSGEVDSDTAGTMKISDLGLGCLYIGGGNATIPASLVPENATNILDTADGTTLTASFGTGPLDCSRGPQATRHCLTDKNVECTSDNDCGFLPGSCAPDVNCYFGPPVPVNGSPTSCVVNTFAADANGTVDTSTGSSTLNITLNSRVYLTLGLGTACPQCVGGACSYGANSGGACTTTNTALTSVDCQPNPGSFVSTLGVDLSPLSTDANDAAVADGLFCPSQPTAGAFGSPDVRRIFQQGSPSGDLTDGNPHASTLVSSFCIPATGGVALDNVAGLPGPGSVSLPGTAQFVTVP
jgi:hypothetical protein